MVQYTKINFIALLSDCAFISYDFVVDNFTDDLLQLHEKEVSKVRQMYENNKQMFENVAHWETLFKQMMEFEVRRRIVMCCGFELNFSPYYIHGFHSNIINIC